MTLKKFYVYSPVRVGVLTRKIFFSKKKYEEDGDRKWNIQLFEGLNGEDLLILVWSWLEVERGFSVIS